MANKIHCSLFHPTLRRLQEGDTSVQPHNLMYPLFLVEDDDTIEEIESMPGVRRYGINTLRKHLDDLMPKGLRAILLFGVVQKMPKTPLGESADSSENPVIRALPKLRSWYPDLVIACDVCLCPYTDHGHCGIFKGDEIDNAASISRMADIAVAYAKAGAHIVAPSDMMDNRVAAIKQRLIATGLEKKCALLAYSAKFASNFYGPFRDAAHSSPAFGDRKCYQLPSGSKGLAARCVIRDADEGADMLMIKPGLPYLDIVRQTKELCPNLPIYIYQVSGEYSMLLSYCQGDRAANLRPMLTEILVSMRRAGADCIITYFTPLILDWCASSDKSLSP